MSTTTTGSTEPKDSASSSKDDEQAWGLRSCLCGHLEWRHLLAQGRCRDAACGCLSFRPAEPEGSASSSGDERCWTCGHERAKHDGHGTECTWRVRRLNRDERCPCHAFAPAEPECPCGSGGPENYEGPARDCPEHGSPEPGCVHCTHWRAGLRCEVCCKCDAMLCGDCEHASHGDNPCGTEGCLCAHSVPEPEAPKYDHDWGPGEDGLGLICRRCGRSHELWSGRECIEPEAPEEPGPTELTPCSICGDRRKTNVFKAGLMLCEPCIYSEGQPYCGACGSKDAPFGLVSHEGEDRFNELRCAKCLLPPRAPYAVAYAIGSGTVVELALPGEASAAVEGGALVIRHASGVLGIQHVKPWEGQ